MKKKLSVKRKKCIMLHQFYNNFTFFKYHNTIKFPKASFTTKHRDLNEFKTNSEIFYKKTIGIKLTNEGKKRNRIMQSCIR